MASDLLSLLIRANLVAAAAIIVAMALRPLVAPRFGARVGYALWLLVPLATLASLLPARQVTLVVTPAPGSDPPPFVPEEAWQVAVDVFLPRIDLAAVGVAVWGAGAVVVLAMLALSQHGFRRALGRLRPDAEGRLRAEACGIGPVLLGFVRPRIVVPADFEDAFDADERTVVLAHEHVHLHRGDHLVNALVALARCVGWFNPLVHVAAAQLRVDQELACDAAVIERHPERLRTYAEAMLKAQFHPATAPLACHWPGRGPHPLKRRIALLQAAAPSPLRRGAGLGLVAALSFGASAAAWAAQPPQVSVVTRHASPAMQRAAWEGEARAEAQRAAVRRARGLSVLTARALDRNLVDAVIAGDERNVAALIGAGADVNAKMTGDGSPLIVAARDGRIDIATRLIRSGANVNGFVLYDETPLINAARAGHLAMVRFLLDNGADPNLAVPSGNAPGETRSPLRMARDAKVAAYLKSRGARS